jgi:hypothetical protein
VTHREPREPGSHLPPGFRRLGDQVPVVEKIPLPAWLVGLILAAIIFFVIWLVFGLLGFGDDPVVEGGAVFAAGLRIRPRALTDLAPTR